IVRCGVLSGFPLSACKKYVEYKKAFFTTPSKRTREQQDLMKKIHTLWMAFDMGIHCFDVEDDSWVAKKLEIVGSAIKRAKRLGICLPEMEPLAAAPQKPDVLDGSA